MKIEKLNDYQIRCTLTKEDLARRGIRVSELAYGSDNARALFRDMMEQAQDNYGFTVDDMPIMIEAIPWAADCLVLVITKCDDPEELDTRFANFAPSVYYDEDDENAGLDEGEDFGSLFTRIQEGGMSSLFESDYAGAKKVKQKSGVGKQRGYVDHAECRVFSFPLLMDVIRIAQSVDPAAFGRNSLYRHKASGRYLLTLHRRSAKKDDPAFSGLCLTLSEYGREEHYVSAGEQFLEEQGDAVIKDNALQVLRQRQ